MSNESSLPSHTRIYYFGDEESWDSFERLWTQRGALSEDRPTPLSSILDLVCRAGLEGPDGAARQCGTVVAQGQYLDRWYADAYGQLYGRQYMEYPRRCTRLHFFEGEISNDKLLPAATPEAERQRITRLQERYLGYAVIQPSYPDTVGRTVLGPPHTPFPKKIVSVPTSNVSLLGARLQIEGTPSMEQDRRVSACATAAVWMTHMALYRQFRLRPHSPRQITELASETQLPAGRAIPSPGLNIGQMSWALSSMGHEPVVMDFRWQAPAALLEQVSAYVRSGLPVILGAVLHTPKPAVHALTVVGYEFGSGPNDSSVRRELDASEWTAGLIVHDDQRGPYHILWLTGELTREGLPQFALLTGYAPCPETLLATGGIRSALAPMPEGAYMTAKEAIYKGYRLFQQFVREAAPAERVDLKLPAQVALRTHLIASSRFKAAYLPPTQCSCELSSAYCGQTMPFALWITEVVGVSPANREMPFQGPLIAEVLMDAMSNPAADDFVTIHFPPYLAHMKPREDEPIAAMRKGLRHPLDDDPPYPSPFEPLL